MVVKLYSPYQNLIQKRKEALFYLQSVKTENLYVSKSALYASLSRMTGYIRVGYETSDTLMLFLAGIDTETNYLSAISYKPETIRMRAIWAWWHVLQPSTYIAGSTTSYCSAELEHY